MIMRVGYTSKIENWSSTKIKLYKMMDSLQSVFPLKYPFSHRHFFQVQVEQCQAPRPRRLHNFVLRELQNFLLCTYNFLKIIYYVVHHLSDISWDDPFGDDASPPNVSECACGQRTTCGFGASVFLSRSQPRRPVLLTPPHRQHVLICHGTEIGFVSKVTLDLSQQAVDISLTCVCAACDMLRGKWNRLKKWRRQWWQMWECWSCWWWPPSLSHLRACWGEKWA